MRSRGVFLHPIVEVYREAGGLDGIQRKLRVPGRNDSAIGDQEDSPPPQLYNIS